MRLDRLVLITALAGALLACADDDRQHHPPAAPGDAATGAEPAPQTPTPESTPFVSAAARHMHAHASQLTRLNAALAAGDLEAAGTPAHWLSRHERIPDLPDGWGLYLSRMRSEAKLIDETSDLAAARAAAQRLADACRGCHYSNGLEIDISAPAATPVPQ